MAITINGDGTLTGVSVGGLPNGIVDTDMLADDAVSTAKMAGLVRGKIIVGDSSGNPVALTVGSSGQALKSDGTDIAWGTDTGGKILSYQYAASSSTNTNTTSTTWVDSVITDAITTTKLNSKILVQANFRFWCNRSSGHNVVGTRVRRTEGGADEFIFMNNSQNWKFPSDIHSGMGSHIWVDSPGKAAGTAITYNIQARVHDTSSSQAWQIDSWHMVLMELDV
tara:strand:+ start:43 stop:714 length:672 start_codon:yes stop_codon:yes gene_type:complete